jgi:hypothetical protein
MAKTTNQKEKELIALISNAKKKLKKIQDKKCLELGELACKYGFDQLELSVVEKHFKAISEKINQ